MSQDIPGLTTDTVPRRLGPKRVGKIRKLYNLSKVYTCKSRYACSESPSLLPPSPPSLPQEDDVRQYIIRRPLPLKEGKPQHYKAPKIQRLITPVRLQRKRHLMALKRKWGEKARAEAAEYARLLARRAKEARDQRAAKRRLSSKKSSTSSM